MAYFAKWHTNDTAREQWLDAPDDDDQLSDLLEVAKEQILAFAPARNDADPVPAGYVVAQLMQARNIWNASQADPANGGIGPDGFVSRPFPLDWMVKQLVRPKRGVPVVG